MNSLRARVEAREPVLHLVEGARELAQLVLGVDRDRLGEVAGRHLSGPRSRRFTRRASALAAKYPVAVASASASRPAIRIWRWIKATFSSTSSSGSENTTTHDGRP